MVSSETLIFGKCGQIARANRVILGPQIISLEKELVDFRIPELALKALDQYQPKVVVNSAAHTFVEKGEDEPQEVYQINSITPGMIAEWCSKNGALFVHYSTDYVFGDSKLDEAYTDDDTTGAFNVYGLSKEECEKRIREICPQHLILRTSWVFSHTGMNFVRTMLRLGAVSSSVKVVSDQIGSPTYAHEIARATKAVISRAMEPGFSDYGTYNLAATGETSWYGFSCAIFEEARKTGIPLMVETVQPVTSQEFVTKARRPLNSRLNTDKIQRVFGVRLPHWRDSLRECFIHLAVDSERQSFLGM